MCDLFHTKWTHVVLVTFFLTNQSLSAQIRAVYFVKDMQLVVEEPKTNFRDSLEIDLYLKELELDAYGQGYLEFSVERFIRIDSFTVEILGFTGPKYKSVSVQIDDEERRFLRKAGIAPRSVSYSRATPQAITRLLRDILDKLEESGYAFAKAGLRGMEVEDGSIKSRLYIEKGPLIRWTALHVVATKLNIGERFMQNYLHIEPGEPFSAEELGLINLRLSQLLYLKQTKPAELLFTEEGAEVFLYLESKPVSLFNGTVGLQQNPVTKSYQFTGDLRLKLQNVLRRGELFDLNWKSIQPGSPQLRLLLNYPFLFNTPFGIDGSFQLFKRDSTFLELQSTLGVTYFLSGGNQLRAFYKNYNSSLLGNTVSSSASTNYGDVKSNQYGLGLTHQSLDYLPNPTTGFLWNIEASVGNRTLTRDTVVTSALTYTGRLRLEYYLRFAKRNVIKLANVTESYTADRMQTNELLRFGGNMSQRGFLEDELLASSRTTGTIEYRFLLDRNSYLFAFYDQSWYERNTQLYVKDHPFGFGAGISFGTNIGIFSLTYALGKQFDNPILLRDSKVHFGYVAYF